LLLVQLTVTQGNDGAQGLYERMGFEAFGVEPYAVAVGQRYVSKVHMWCDLRK
jgi:ribosomal protein S18 acetylase RimI-like enzyme